MSMHEQHHAGAEVITDMPQSMTNTGNYPFFALDDAGCIGTESNLLDCLPQHNCGKNRGAENAGVQCLRKGEHIPANNYNSMQVITLFHWMGHIRSQTRAWSQPRKQ